MPDLLRKIFLPTGEPKPEPHGGFSAVVVGNVLGSQALPDIWQTAPVALALVGEGTIEAWNSACRTLLHEAIGGSELASRRWLAASVARLLAGGRTQEVLSAADEGLRLEVRLGPAAVGSSARVVVLREVRGGQRDQGDLAETVSTLSHELRTPLTSMKSSLNLVLSGDTGVVSAEQTHFLSMTMRNINRLERLVSDLLDVSRTQAGQVGLRRRESDLGPVLREAMQMQEAAARQAGLAFDFRGLPAELIAHVDADKVVQILTNVVSNAIKYTPEGGLVRVWQEVQSRSEFDGVAGLAGRLAERCDLALSLFSLVIADSGVGMSREDQDRIFEPWFRGAEDNQGDIPGAGLGLHITRSLVEAHGGSIGLASSPGQGTTVWVRLPRDPVSEGLLQGAKQLQAMLDGTDLVSVAILDGRNGQYPVQQVAQEFLGRQSHLMNRSIVTLAPEVVATVISEPEGWAAAWHDYLETSGRSSAPVWQYSVMESVAAAPGNGNKQ